MIGRDTHTRVLSSTSSPAQECRGTVWSSGKPIKHTSRVKHMYENIRFRFRLMTHTTHFIYGYMS